MFPRVEGFVFAQGLGFRLRVRVFGFSVAQTATVKE